MANSTQTLNDRYQAPSAELVNARSAEDGLPLFIVSTRKLFWMYTLTFGLYGLVWFYQHYKSIKKHNGSSIWPVSRAIFSGFFAHNLFRQIHENASTVGITAAWSHTSLATAYVVMYVLSGVIDNISEIAGLITLAFVPIIAYILGQVQATANESQNDADGTANSRFTLFNYMWSLLGVAIWLLVFLGAAMILGIIPE